MKLAKKLGVLSLAAIGAMSLGLGINSHINQYTNVDYDTVTYGNETYSTTTYQTEGGTQQTINIDGVDYLLPQITTVNNSTALNSEFGLVVFNDSVQLELNGLTYYDVPLTMTITSNLDGDGDLNDRTDSVVTQQGLGVNIYLDMSETNYVYVTEVGPTSSGYDYEYELALFYGISENQSTSFDPSNVMTYEYKYAQYVSSTETLQWQIQLPYALWSYDFFIVNETDYDYSYPGTGTGNAGANQPIKAITTNYVVDDSLNLVMWQTVSSNNYISTLDYSDLMPHFEIVGATYDASYENMTLEFNFYGQRYDLDWDTTGSLDVGTVTMKNLWFLFDYVNTANKNNGQETGTEIGYATLSRESDADSVIVGQNVGPANDHVTNVKWSWDLSTADTVLLDTQVSSLAVWDNYYAADTDNIRTTTQNVDLTANGVRSSQVDDYSINYDRFDVKLTMYYDYLGTTTTNDDIEFFAPTQSQYFSSLRLAPAVDNSMEAWAITLIVWGSAVLTVALIVIGMNMWERHKKYGSMFSSKYSWMHAHHVNEKIVLTNKDTGEVIEMERDL